MQVHSYGTDSDDRPDVPIMERMDEPEAQRELLAKYGYETLAARAELVTTTRYPSMRADLDTFRRYFSETPDRKTLTVPVDDLLPDMAKADEATNSKGKKLFADLEIWATPDNSALLLVGVVGTDTTGREYFLVSQANNLSHMIEVSEMRKHLTIEGRANAKLSQRERRNAKWLRIADVTMGPVFGIIAIATLSLLVFWQNWNWWLIGVIIFAGVALICSIDESGKETGTDPSSQISAWLSGLCIAMMVFYGLANFFGAVSQHTITDKTILACKVTSSANSVLTTQSGDQYYISDGRYDVTQNGQIGTTTTIFEPTSAAAAATFKVGHTYKVVIDSSAMDGDQVTSAKEVANTLGQCG
ncbi:MAG: hypothetical protein ACQR33_00085 [Candidatus Saccharibacteria bacterium]